MTKVAVVGGVVVLGFVCYLAAAGFSAALVPLLTVAALVLFIAGGNWLHGWSAAPPRGAPPSSAAPPPAGGAAPTEEPGDRAPGPPSP